MPCRISRCRIWTHRILLESLKHGDSCFVTLTYDQKNHPAGGTLVKKHYQDFLKRLRKVIAPTKIRFFLVGEYGENTQRPHFHAAIFGIGSESATIIQNAWGRGFTDTGTLTKDSAKYIAGYVTKKLNGRDERSKTILGGRTPEFARMSLRPGIGAPATIEISNALSTAPGLAQLSLDGDVPFSLVHGSYSMPLGRYLRRKIREEMGIKKEATPFKDASYGSTEASLKNFRQKVLDMLEESRKGSEKHMTNRQRLINLNKQKVLNLETKYNIFKSKGIL